MKFLAVSLSALLSTLVYTTSAAAPTTVYFFSHGRPSAVNCASHGDLNAGDNLPSLNIKETRATLAHLLNLGQSTRHTGDQSFVDMQGPIQQVFKQPGMTRKDLFATIGANLMMVIEGVKSPQDLMPSYDASFTVESSEDIQDVVSDLADRVPTQDRYLFNTHESSVSGDALVNEHLVAEHHANVDMSVFDLTKKADALFLEESVSLGNYIDTYVKKHNAQGQESDFVRVTLKGLSALAAEHGDDSVQYKTGQQILKEFLQTTFLPEFEQIHKTYTATIFLVAPNTRQGSEMFSKRAAPGDIFKRGLPATGHCFETEADCQTNTGGCSQQGACVFSEAAHCYHCKCAKINNTQYSGKHCDKVDLSVQFHLFFWLGLGLFLAVALAVGLILQMGNQSQGGVPVGPTRAQLKRD
ncbi:hypothetical protein BGZ97_010138 [Linnemannia gamsii]|uniref:DUF3844 domain-containing protein n=1 Tax=Linnemannia gamsii TaxID=64522 RepID=A0A9P6UPD5_9FUNG|nr:hypothetical protein BGZ97_010138 [Linnemannia gamsii]